MFHHAPQKTSEYESVTNVPPDSCLERRAAPYVLQTPGSGGLLRARTTHIAQGINGVVRHSGEIVGARSNVLTLSNWPCRRRRCSRGPN